MAVWEAVQVKSRNRWHESHTLGLKDRTKFYRTLLNRIEVNLSHGRCSRQLWPSSSPANSWHRSKFDGIVANKYTQHPTARRTNVRVLMCVCTCEGRCVWCLCFWGETITTQTHACKTPNYHDMDSTEMTWHILIVWSCRSHPTYKED